MNPKGYRRISIDSVMHYAHRLAWFYVNGAAPTEVIDHIDGNRDHNAITNLRDVPHLVNCENKTRPQKRNTFKLLGVRHQPKGRKRRYCAEIKRGGKRLYLGSFETPEAAHAAYLSAAAAHL